MIQKALNQVCNGVEIPELASQIEEAQKYQNLLNKIADFNSLLTIVNANWNHFDPLGVYGEGSEFSQDEYIQYANNTAELLIANFNFEDIKSYVLHVCEKLLDSVPADYFINQFVANLIKIRSKVC